MLPYKIGSTEEHTYKHTYEIGSTDELGSTYKFGSTYKRTYKFWSKYTIPHICELIPPAPG